MKCMLFTSVLAICLGLDLSWDKNVLKLRDETFNMALDKYPQGLLVNFYTPTCGHCRKFEMELQKLGETLQESNVTVGKINADRHSTTATAYDVRKYPTLLFFKDKNYTNYYDFIHHDSIVPWVQRQMDPFTESKEKDALLKEKKPLAEMVTQRKVYIKNFRRACAILDTISCMVTDPEKDQSSLTFYSSDGSTAVYDSTKKYMWDEMLKWLVLKALPVSELNDKLANSILVHGQPAFVIFKLRKDRSIDEVAKEVNLAVRKDIIMVIAHVDDTWGKKLVDYMMLNMSSGPQMWILEPVVELRMLKKYRLKEEFNKENILAFVEDWANKAIEPEQKEQKAPKVRKGELVRTLVKSTFKQFVQQPKDVFLILYTQWCPASTAALETLTKIAEQYQDNTRLAFAKIDMWQNDVEIYTQRTPSFHLFPSQGVLQREYFGDLDQPDMEKWMRKYGPVLREAEAQDEGEQEQSGEFKIKVEQQEQKQEEKQRVDLKKEPSTFELKEKVAEKKDMKKEDL